MDCPKCGSGYVTRDLSSTDKANRSSNRLIGGQNMSVTRVCKDCGWRSDGTHEDTGRSYRTE